MTVGRIMLIVLIALVAVAVVAGVVMLQSRKRSEGLQGHFGQEYDRTVEARGDQKEAERELLDRQDRRSSFEVRELDPSRRQEFAQSWDRAQGQFVDDPSAAVTAAYGLVQTVMSERGYPTEEFERQADDISVDHPEVVGDYREAVRISEASGRGEASTEDLREAMVRFRSLFARLLDTDTDADAETHSRHDSDADSDAETHSRHDSDADSDAEIHSRHDSDAGEGTEKR